MRLPAILGFWIFCLAYIDSPRQRDQRSPYVGPAAYDGVYHYSYEVRPHDDVLGWCGIALMLADDYSGTPSFVVATGAGCSFGRRRMRLSTRFGLFRNLI
jgi:hypothetical protein